MARHSLPTPLWGASIMLRRQRQGVLHGPGRFGHLCIYGGLLCWLRCSVHICSNPLLLQHRCRRQPDDLRAIVLLEEAAQLLLNEGAVSAAWWAGMSCKQGMLLSIMR